MRPAVVLAILILFLAPALVRLVLGPPVPDHPLEPAVAASHR
ncbi:hypothetical protein [Geminicoccus roseus]|nr:hypothetical protein [Geminicoccus roseus]